MKPMIDTMRCTLLGILVVASASATADIEETYQQTCTSCHGSEVYTREDRRVTSYDGLARQVRRCESALGLKWFDDEIDDMTAYLNRKFYRFMPAQ